MRVIVWGINYPPEMTGIAPFNAALCEFLAEKGHNVEMITSFSYYPEWKKRDEDRGYFFRTDQMNKVSIFRCWSFVPTTVSALRRIVHEGSFVASSLIRVLTRCKPSVYIVVSPPLLLGVAAWCAGKIKGAPFVFHVQDLQPDAAVSLGMLQTGVLTRLLYWIETFAYSRAVRVSAISSGIVDKLRAKGIDGGKLVLFPNGVRLPVILPKRGQFRQRYDISNGSFLAVYSGNLGVKQGLDVLLDAARILQANGKSPTCSEADRILIVIAGDGARRAILAKAIDSEVLKNILLLPLLPEVEYLEMLSDADCTVIAQQRNTGAFFFPSKLLSSVAAAKPVLSVADEHSELAKAVRGGNLGINVSPDRPELLVEALREMAIERRRCATNVRNDGEFTDCDPADSLSEMGRSGLEFAEQFEIGLVLESFEKELMQIGCSNNGKR